MLPITSISEKRMAGLLAGGQTSAADLQRSKGSKAANFSTVGEAELQRLTSRQLTRVYPKATRFDSSNLDPLPCWRA